MAVEAVQQQVAAYQGSVQGEKRKEREKTVVTAFEAAEKESDLQEKNKTEELQIDRQNPSKDIDSKKIEKQTGKQVDKEPKKTATELLLEQQEQIEKDNKRIRKAVQELNKKSKGDTEVKLRIHEKSNRLMIKIVDKKTQKVIREYPPEETLDAVTKVLELAGMIVDKKM